MSSASKKFYDLEEHPTTAFRGDKRKFTKGRKDEEEWLEDQAPYKLFKPAPAGTGRYKRRRVVATDIDNVWQADLADFQDYAKENGGYRYLLTVLDVFSRWGMVEPVKNKSGETVARALETIMNRENRMPIKLNTDKGREFVNPQVMKLLRVNGIELYHTRDQEMKATMVERFIKTIKDILTRLLIYRETLQWGDKIQAVVRGYNRTVHSSLKMAPLDVMNADDYDKHLLRETMLPHTCDKVDDFFRNIQDDLKLNVNDWVLLQREKGRFEKGFTVRWTREPFQIWKKCYKHGRVMFHVKDEYGEHVEGSWLSDQLQKVSGPFTMKRVVERVVDRKPGQVKVKYLGFPDKYNRWVSNETMQPITERQFDYG